MSHNTDTSQYSYTHTQYHHTTQCIVYVTPHIRILTPFGSTTPVTSTPFSASDCIALTSPALAALYILLLSSYNNITDNNIILLIQYQSHIHASCCVLKSIIIR